MKYSIPISLKLAVVGFLACGGSATARAEMDIDELVAMDGVALAALPFEEKVEAVTVYSSHGIDEYPQKYHNLVKEVAADGERAIPILAELLPKAERGALAASIVSFLGGIEVEDRGLVDETFKKVATGELTFPTYDIPNDPHRVIRGVASHSRYYGDASDSRYLLPLLDHEDHSVRIISVETLGLIGDPITANRIVEILAARAARLSPEERAADEVFKFGEVAVEDIGKRHPEAVQTTPPGLPDADDAPEKEPALGTNSEQETEGLETLVEKENPQKDYRIFITGSIVVLAMGILLYWRFKS